MMKSKVLQTVGLAMLVCLLATPVRAGGLIMYEVDSPSTGTASAGWAALAKDGATAFQNPAGMTRLDRSQVLAGVQPMVQQLQDQLKVTILDEILFPEGGWEIGPKSKQTLNKIVPVLKTLQGKRVEVNGYTDNVPIAPAYRWRFPSNWELSTARATDVVRYLVSQGVNPAILSATAFGEQNPAASNDTAQGTRQNRRLELVITAMNP